MEQGLAALVSAFGIGGLIGSVTTLLVKDHLARLAEERHRRVKTDLATYQERLTVLITANLSAFIRSNRCREEEREEIEILVRELTGGLCRQRFLDPRVQSVWERFLKKSVECGIRRLNDTITDREVADYTKAWERWKLAAGRSFGPLPENDPPRLRRRPIGPLELEEAV